jgi:hypothetical protein
MTLSALLAIYAVAGTGCALVRLAWRGQPGGQWRDRWFDAVFLLLVWPLHGPFLLMRLHEGAADSEVAFLVALRRAGDTPLGSVLPDAGTARALATRLRVAAAKVEEIDQILARPEFSEPDAQRRLHALEARQASECAISTATMRVQNIRRLRALRNRFANELDEIGELLMQLTTQAEVVRLAGAPTGAEPWSELVRELVSRVEGLDQMLDDDPQLLDARG